MDTRQQTGERKAAELWSPLPYDSWKETLDTLHMWTQIVGKVRMELSPFLNHWWHVPLYVTPRGLTTSAILCREGTFEVTFDFIEHNLFMRASEGTTRALPLIPRSVASFYREFMDCLHALGIQVTINTLPSEVQSPIRCDVGEVHASYDPLYAQRFWRVLAQTSTVMQRYCSPFLGKSSPVHLFWGSFDLAVTLFSGRRAPERPGANRMMRKRCPMKRSVVASGPAMSVSPPRRSMSIPLRNRLACQPSPFVRRRPSTVTTWENSSCCMMTCGRPPRQSRRCWSFSRVPTKRGHAGPLGQRSAGKESRVRTIGHEELKQMLDRQDDFRLVMALSEWAYQAKHIPSSLHFATSREALQSLNKEDEIVVYCSDENCIASTAFGQLLERQGYTHVLHFAGGLAEWELAGYPLEGEWIRQQERQGDE